MRARPGLRTPCAALVPSPRTCSLVVSLPLLGGLEGRAIVGEEASLHLRLLCLSCFCQHRLQITRDPPSQLLLALSPAIQVQ